MKLNQLIQVIEGFCPNSLAEEWDNCGFQLRCENQEISRVMVSLEITESIINEAIENDVDLIITHHPMIFGGINSVDNNTVIGKYILRLAEADISVYSCHTSFDKMDGGNNDYLGDVFQLRDVKAFDNGNVFCRKGETPFEVTFAEFIHKAAEFLEIEEKYFRIVGDLTSTVETVGWCTGAGSEFIQEAKDEGCDFYITGDVKYHEAQLAKEMGMSILDVGHYGSEKIFTENMAAILREKILSEEKSVEIIESKIDINPFI